MRIGKIKTVYNYFSPRNAKYDQFNVTLSEHDFKFKGIFYTSSQIWMQMAENDRYLIRFSKVEAVFGYYKRP